MVTSEDIENFSEYLEQLSSGYKLFYDSLKKLNGENVNHSLIRKSEEYLKSGNSRLEKLKSAYDTFSSQFYEICDVYIGKVNTIQEEDRNEVELLRDNFEEIKEDMERKNNELKAKNLYAEREPSFVYNDSLISKINGELVMNYSGSYLYREYMSDHRTKNGDVFIDLESGDDELIVKYMKNDTSLVENVKEMNANQKNNLIKELDFLELPIKHEICCHLYEDKDNATMEAWRKREVLVNSSRSVEFNELLKRHQLFEPLFAQHHLEDIRYHKTLNIYYINIELYYFDIILLYLREEKFSKDLIQRYGNIKTIKEELQQEMEKIGIQLTEEQINLIETYSDERSLRGSNIIDLGTDQKLAKWIGKDHQWKLIYRASEHDFSSKSFHKCCDNQKPTIVLVQSTNHCIFGGYTTQSWSGNGMDLV